MATAKEPGGAYYDSVRKIMVDAEGKELKGVAKPGPDTPADQQPGALSAPSSEERLATAIVTAFRGGATAGAASGSAGESASASDSSDGGEVTLADLPDHISKMSATEVKALQKKDDRKGAVPIYEARLAELEK